MSQIWAITQYGGWKAAALMPTETCRFSSSNHLLDCESTANIQSCYCSHLDQLFWLHLQPSIRVSASTLARVWADFWFPPLFLSILGGGTGKNNIVTNWGVKLICTVHFLQTKIREKPSACNWILTGLRSLCSFNCHSIRKVWHA